MNPEVDEYVDNAETWGEAFAKLRAIALDCELTEEVKWGKPCYTFEGSNIVIIQGFKEHCALMFFKGVLLDDPEDILVKPGPNTRTARRVEFTDVETIVDMESTLKAYIDEAIEVEKAGLEVELEEEPEPIPDELQRKFDELPELEKAFEALTPGRQRAYILYFSDAKKSETRERRVEKYIDKILDGKGMRD